MEHDLQFNERLSFQSSHFPKNYHVDICGHLKAVDSVPKHQGLLQGHVLVHPWAT